MAAGTPLTRLALGAGSVADDLGFVALNDVAGALGDITADYRVIGGHMVTMLAARWQLGAGLYRETGDVDLGIPPVVARDRRVVSRLKDIDYRQVGGNRFARGLSDIPARVVGESGPPDPEALIDVLIPAYTSRARENVQGRRRSVHNGGSRPASGAGATASNDRAGTTPPQRPDAAVRTAICRRTKRLGAEGPRDQNPVQGHRHSRCLEMPGDSLHCRT
jgi:hypothetical protein